jgi:uncharacterized protein HemX
MKWMLAIALGLGAGCASSGEIRANAYAHQQRANALEAHGDYVAAARERAAADKQLRKAEERASTSSLPR